MPEKKPEISKFEELEQKVLSHEASDDEIREYFILRDLTGLPSTVTYLKESQFTKEWMCPDCGGPIPCSIDCPQCGHARPVANHDEEQEGQMGERRRAAGWRP